MNNVQTGRFSNKFAVKCNKAPTTPCICCHITLRNVNVIKEPITDKLQGNVAHI